MKKFTLFLGALLISMVSMAAEATISFADVANRKTLNNDQQVWEQNGLIVTGNKSASTTNVADYSNPARFYQGSSLTIKCTLGNITKIVIDGNNGKPVSGIQESIGDEATLDGNMVTVIPTETSDTYVIEKFTAQVRINAITVTYTGNGETPDDGGETPDDGGETPANVTFDFTTKDGLEALGIAYPTTDAGNGACATDLEEGKAYSQNGISLTAKYGSTATRIWLAASGKLDLRHYKGGVLTFAAPSGKVITNIVFDGADVSGLTTLVDKAWTGNASTVEIPAAADAKTIKINTITVHVADASSDYVATPAISGETNFLENTTVTITAEEGLEVYYTLDGTDPTKASNKYTAPFELTATTTVKAIAYKGDKASAVVCKTFTKTPLIGCAEVNALASGEIAYMKPFDVVYVVEGAGYIYIKDETGNALIYSYDWDESTYFTPGDHVEGFIGKSSPYNGLPELKPNCNYEDLTITKGGTPTEPTILTEVPEAADVHKYVQFNGVKFKEDATFAKDKATNATMLVAETEVVLRNAFKFETALMANKQYNIVGFVALYNDAVQVYFLKAEALSTAVDNITIDQNAVKFIENGQLFIVKDGVRYNVIGQVTK